MESRVTPSRIAALDALRRVRQGELADRALDAAGFRLDPRDRAWTQELVLGTFRLRGRLDWLLEERVRGGVARLEPDVLDVLRLGAYQLLEMGSVPAYAAVSQSVDLVRIAGSGGAAGLVNGVLQALRRAGTPVAPDFGADPVGYLSGWESHPRWIVERWVARWGADEARALAEADNRRPGLYLRPVGLSADAALSALEAAGIPAEALTAAPDSVRILPPGGAGEALDAVPAVVQDPAAALVVRYAAVPAGSTVIDLCAAPGGKALGMSDSATYVAAADQSWRRMRRMRENVARLGRQPRVAAVVADARTPPFRPADAVLLDAPCTGTGTFRRHPDGRWRVQPRDLDALTALQSELLEAAAPLVRPGGLLVYSTCSLEAEENEGQSDAFLARHPEFAVEPPDAGLDADLLDDAGRLVVLPQRHGTDGAFAVRMRRAG
ncbi:MAG: sun protein [Gemmatimonadetes bacterium]|nr:sun protein [Gemmatimonadota bacterium]